MPSACLDLPLKAATAAMTLFCFFGETGGGAIGSMLKSLVPVSVLARLNPGLAGLFLEGDMSLARPSLPFVSESGTRSPLFLREKVSSNEAVEIVLGTTMDLGRSFAAGRRAGRP